MKFTIPTAMSLPHAWRAARTADRVLLAVLYAMLTWCLIGDVISSLRNTLPAPEVLYVNLCAFPVEVRLEYSSDFVVPPNRAKCDPEPGVLGFTSATVLRNGVTIEKISSDTNAFRDENSPDVYKVYVSDLGGRTYTGPFQPQDESDFDALAREYGYGVVGGLCVYLLWMHGYIAIRLRGAGRHAVRLTRAKLAALPDGDRRHYAIVTGLTIVAAGSVAVAFPVLDADPTPTITRIWIGIAAAALWHALNVRWAGLRRAAALLPNLP